MRELGSSQANGFFQDKTGYFSKSIQFYKDNYSKFLLTSALTVLPTALSLIPLTLVSADIGKNDNFISFLGIYALLFIFSLYIWDRLNIALMKYIDRVYLGNDIEFRECWKKAAKDTKNIMSFGILHCMTWGQLALYGLVFAGDRLSKFLTQFYADENQMMLNLFVAVSYGILAMVYSGMVFIKHTPYAIDGYKANSKSEKRSLFTADRKVRLIMVFSLFYLMIGDLILSILMIFVFNMGAIGAVAIILMQAGLLPFKLTFSIVGYSWLKKSRNAVLESKDS